LQFLYAQSPSARSVLEAADSRDVWLLKTESGSRSPDVKSQVVAIDLANASTLQWMGSDGRLQTEALAVTLIHELIHAMNGYGYEDLVDPKNPSHPYLGTTR